MQTAEQRKKRVHYKGIDLSCWYTAKNTRSPWRFAGLGAGWRNFGRLVEWCPTPEWCGGARLETGGTNRRSWDLFNGVGWCVFFVFSMVFVCFVWLRHTFFFQGLVVLLCGVAMWSVACSLMLIIAMQIFAPEELGSIYLRIYRFRFVVKANQFSFIYIYIFSLFDQWNQCIFVHLLNCWGLMCCSPRSSHFGRLGLV